MYGRFETATHVRIVLQAHHEPRAHQRVEDVVASLVIQPADFRRLPRTHFIAGRHGEQKILQLIKSDIDLGSTHLGLPPLDVQAMGQVECPMAGAYCQAFTSTVRKPVSSLLHGVKKIPIPHEPAGLPEAHLFRKTGGTI